MENKLFGAVKLEDLGKPSEAPKEEAPKMGERKEEAKPAEVIVPKTPDQVEKKDENSTEQGNTETGFQIDMMVEAEEEVNGAQGIFSTGQPVQKAVTPIESANTWHDKTSFKDKTATHAERVFETDQAIKEEQEEKKKEEADKASAEEGAKRANKAWGKGTSDVVAPTEKPAESTEAKPAEAKPEETKAAEATPEAKPAEASKSAPLTPEERAEPAPVGIFTPTKKAKGGSLGGFFDKIKAVLTKPVGKEKKK